MAAAKLAKELGGKADLQVPKRHGHGWNLEWGGDRMRIGQTDGSSLARCTQPSGLQEIVENFNASSDVRLMS